MYLPPLTISTLSLDVFDLFPTLKLSQSIDDDRIALTFIAILPILFMKRMLPNSEPSWTPTERPEASFS